MAAKSRITLSTASLSAAQIEQIAAVTHAANREWCRQNGDRSQDHWDYAPKWQRISAIEGVKFHVENPEASPEASHESWMAQKEADGWTYGEVKDPVARTHPCMVPYDELPFEQRAKDHIFQGIIHAMIAAHG